MAEINAINATEVQTSAVGVQAEEEDELSTATKKELEALGIPVTEGMTEAEAQEKIQEAKLQKQAAVGEDAPSEAEIMADVKTLASQIGVVYSDSDDTEEILANIADELEAQIDEAENNPNELSTLMGYFNKLKDLDTVFDEMQSVQETIYAAMDMVATKNKKEHGLE